MAEQELQAGTKAPRSISAERLVVLAEAIFAVARSMTIAVMLHVGDLILREIYEDDLEIWAKRNAGDQSLERLALELQGRGLEDWTANQLYRATRLTEQSRQLGGLDTWPNLTASHFRVVQGLPWDKQRQLLDRADNSQLTVAQLQAIVTGERSVRPVSEAASSASQAARALKRIAQIAGDSAELAEDLSAAGFAAEEIKVVVERLAALEASIAPLREKLAESRKQMSADVSTAQAG